MVDIEALRAIGVLDALIETSEGLIVYPQDSIFVELQIGRRNY